MNKLNEVLLDEIESFRELGHKFLNGEVSRGDFKGVSGGMGVYSHRNGKEFMIRLRIPSGIITLEQLHIVYDFAEKCNLEKIHLTTREAIQLHGISIDQVCNIMEEGIKKGIYTRGGGGNFPRNVAMSPLSGVDPEEAFDVTPYALAVNKYFMERIYTYKLPRKIKVAFSSSNEDFAHCTVTDLGFLAVNCGSEKKFKVFLGGGLGRNPKVGVEYPSLIDPKDVLYYVEAMVNLFVEEGDYENKGKARIRYIVERLGKEQFINLYKKYLKETMDNHEYNIDVKENIINKQGLDTDIKNPALFQQKQPGLYSIYVHPIGGQLYLKNLKDMLDTLDTMDNIEIRLTMTEGMYIRNLNGKEAERALNLVKTFNGNTRIQQSVACIGVPTCQMGILNSQNTLGNIINKFKEEGVEKDILPRIFISGCPNSCGAHEIGAIGLTGKIKRVNNESKNAFELHLGGVCREGETTLGEVYGDILEDNIADFLLALAKEVEKDSLDFQQWMEKHKEKLKELVGQYSV